MLLRYYFSTFPHYHLWCWITFPPSFQQMWVLKELLHRYVYISILPSHLTPLCQSLHLTLLKLQLAEILDNQMALFYPHSKITPPIYWPSKYNPSLHPPFDIYHPAILDNKPTSPPPLTSLIPPSSSSHHLHWVYLNYVTSSTLAFPLYLAQLTSCPPDLLLTFYPIPNALMTYCPPHQL